MSKQGELLIELGTAEIPAVILPKLVSQLEKNLSNNLSKHNISYNCINSLYTPRRISLNVLDILKILPGKTIKKRGPSLKVAFDDNNNPTKACIGFANSFNANVKDLQQDDEYVFFTEEIQERNTIEILPEILHQTVTKVSSIKGMRWGEIQEEFIRPVYWLLAILDREIVPFKAFGIEAKNITYGHRVHSNKEIKIASNKEYISKLKESYVIVSQDERRKIIEDGIKKIEQRTSSHCFKDVDLLNEVNNLIEYPVVLQGVFDKRFLELPKPVINTTIMHHQRCFPLIDDKGEPYPGFILVSNIKSLDEDKVIEGNQNVMQARLSDAEFFFKSDISKSINYYLDLLKNIQMHHKLGSISQQSVRISKLIQSIVDKEYSKMAQRAGHICKFDLATDIVGEFPELQGIIGYHYAKLFNEDKEVALAVQEQYMPTTADGEIPSSNLGCALALAYRIDHLVGYFGIGIKPKGDHDPFALRRSALIIIKIIQSSNISISLRKLIEESFLNYEVEITKDVEGILFYILERLKSFYVDLGFEPTMIDAVVSLRLDNLLEIDRRIKSLEKFLKNNFAKDLALSNKRVRKILQKSEENLSEDINENLFEEESEKLLFNNIDKIYSKTEDLTQEWKFEESLQLCSTLKESIDDFFDKILVMSKDHKVRANRMNLLYKLQCLFNKVADLSKIQVEKHNE